MAKGKKSEKTSSAASKGSASTHARKGTTAGAISEVTLVVLGVALITSAATNAAAYLSKLGLPISAPGSSAPARIVYVLLGLALLIPVLWGRWGPVGRPLADLLHGRWRGWRAAKPPARDVGVPPDRNPLFADRGTELEQLRERLAAKRRVDLTGLGGVGKSSLALEYLHRWHEVQYSDGVFWLRGARLATLTGDLAALAWLPELNLDERHLRDQRKVIAAVVKWLREHDSWLLVIDNLDDQLVGALNELLGRGLRGHVIVTCPTPVWADPLPVEPMPPEVATRYLLDRTRQDDVSVASGLAHRLDYLPLALEQAAAYMRTTGSSLSEYDELAKTRLGELMKLEDVRPRDYPYTVATTWSLSFDRVQQQSAAAAALLRVCAFLAPEDIPLKLLRAVAGELGGMDGAYLVDDIRFDHAIGVLQRYSLIGRRGDGLQIHRLVQTVVRGRLTRDSRRQTLGVALRALKGEFPTAAWSDPKYWGIAARLLPHVEAAINQLPDDGAMVEPRASGWLLDRIASYLQARGNLREARPYCELALAIYERVLGPEHPDTATSLNNLAYLLWAAGELSAARPLYERALGIFERLLGPEHPLTARTLNNLAVLRQNQGDLEVARRFYERALAIREKVLGAEDPDTVLSLNSLAYLLKAEGNLDAARPLYERALAIRQRTLGAEHPDTATSLSNLATLFRAQGAGDVARHLHERALAIHERILGPEHPETAVSLNNLGTVLQDKGEVDSARPLYERALAIREKILGPNHSNTALSVNNLGTLLRDQGELDAARALHERALAVRETILGPEHPDTAQSLRNLAVVLQAQGEMDAARPLYERALAIREKVLGPKHPSTTRVRRDLAEMNSMADQDSLRQF